MSQGLQKCVCVCVSPGRLFPLHLSTLMLQCVHLSEEGGCGLIFLSEDVT